mmetsp:Transcript_54167/g.156513  ORF Transcript_54167/g.156513 Transcript_54167/m.156513 type:complete len:262 (-) Transcript_54167:1472-2257(-)
MCESSRAKDEAPLPRESRPASFLEQRVNKGRLPPRQLRNILVICAVLRELDVIALHGLHDRIGRDSASCGLGQGRDAGRDGLEGNPHLGIVAAQLLRQQRPHERLRRDAHKVDRQGAEEHLRHTDLQDAADHARRPVGAAHKDGNLAYLHAGMLQNLFHSSGRHRVTPNCFLHSNALAEEVTNVVLPRAGQKLHCEADQRSHADAGPEADVALRVLANNYAEENVHCGPGDRREQEHHATYARQYDAQRHQLHIGEQLVEP